MSPRCRWPEPLVGLQVMQTRWYAPDVLTDDAYQRLARRKGVCTQAERLVVAADELLRKSVRFQQEVRKRLETCRAELLIRRRLSEGRLPYHKDAVIAGRPGRGGRCDGCRQPLRWTQLVMEIPRGDEPPAQLHADCFQLWDKIRRTEAP